MFHARVESRHSSSTRFVLGRRCSTGTWVSVTFSVALLMTFQVQGQVIRTWKTAIAMNTFERLGTSVFAIMASQFVTSGESPLTSFPRTLVRLLTCKKTKKKFHSFHPKKYNGKGLRDLKLFISKNIQLITQSTTGESKRADLCDNIIIRSQKGARGLSKLTCVTSTDDRKFNESPPSCPCRWWQLNRTTISTAKKWTIDASIFIFFLANDVGLHDGQDQQVSTPSVGLWIDGRSSAKASREPVPFAIQMNHRWRHLPPRTEFSLADELTNRRRSRSADKSDGTLPILCRGRHIPSRSLPSPAAGLWLCQCLN